MKQWLKDNGGMLGIISTAAVAVGVFAELRIRQHLEQMNVPTDDRIAGIEQDIDETRETHKADRDRQDDKIERIVDILLED